MTDKKITPIMMFVAQFETAVQISPDDFSVRNPTLHLTENTTIGDIYEWYRLSGNISAMEVKISQLTQLETK